jgi:putative transposase
MAFWRCYYHIVWTTKNREPAIAPQNEAILFAAIEDKSAALKCPVLAVNAVADHVHVAVCISPMLAIVDWVKNIKGVSSRAVNAALPEMASRFRWQNSYGVLTFGVKNQEFVLDYIARQKEHPANSTIQAYMEQTDEAD